MFKALVVDDEKVILDMVAAILEKAGFEVVPASSAGAAITILAADKFDIVVTDLRMESPLAGFEVVRAARQLKPRPVIVILTGFPVPRSDWKASGADALFVKGVNTVADRKSV